MVDTAINILTDPDNVDQDVYRLAEAYIQAILTLKFPDRDFSVGRGLYWLVVVPAAQAAALQIANARLVSNSLNLGAARANPEAVQDELADLLLSNYYVSRDAGARSTGTASIVVDRLATYVLSEGAVLRSGDLEYELSTTIFAYPNSDQVRGPSDRLLVPQIDSTWTISVPIRATTDGSGTSLPRGTLLSMQAPPPGFVRAISATDVSGGRDEQSLQDLLSDVPEKFAASTWGSRNTVRGLLAELFPSSTSWVIGFGDPEMLRDKHNPIGIASGGYSDVWLSTGNSISQRDRTVTAELINETARTWRFTLDRDAAAGLYTVDAVRRGGGNPLVITSVERGLSVSSAPGAPMVFNELEAAFSAYQTISVQFTDASDASGLVVGDTRDYTISTSGMANIREASDMLASAGYLNPASNVLVRGVVPCRVSISMVVRLLDSDFEEGIDVAGMRRAIISRVASIGLGYGVLSSSIILDSVHDFLSGRSDIGGTTVSLRGDIYAPTNEVLNIGQGDGRELVVPNSPTKQVTKNTTKFFTDNSLIEIEFSRVDI